MLIVHRYEFSKTFKVWNFDVKTKTSCGKILFHTFDLFSHVERLAANHLFCLGRDRSCSSISSLIDNQKLDFHENEASCGKNATWTFPICTTTINWGWFKKKIKLWNRCVRIFQYDNKPSLCVASHAIFVKELCDLWFFLAIASHLHFAAVIIRTRNKINFHDKAHTNTKVSVGRLEARSVFHVSQSGMLFIIQEQYSTYTRICIRSMSCHFKKESNEIFWSVRPTDQARIIRLKEK